MGLAAARRLPLLRAVLSAIALGPVTGHQLPMLLGVGGTALVAAAASLVAIDRAVLASPAGFPVLRNPLPIVGSVRGAALVAPAPMAVHRSSAMLGLHNCTVSRETR